MKNFLQFIFGVLDWATMFVYTHEQQVSFWSVRLIGLVLIALLFGWYAVGTTILIWIGCIIFREPLAYLKQFIKNGIERNE